MEKSSFYQLGRRLNSDEWSNLLKWKSDPSNFDEVLVYGDKIKSKPDMFFGDYDLNSIDGEKWYGFGASSENRRDKTWGDRWAVEKAKIQTCLAEQISFLNINSIPSPSQFQELLDWAYKTPESKWNYGDEHPKNSDYIFIEYSPRYRNGEHWKSKLKVAQEKEGEAKGLNDEITFKSLVQKFISQSFKRCGFVKKKDTESILGIDYPEFKKYIESQFEPWMNWGVYGTIEGDIPHKINQCFDIDHKIPLSSCKSYQDVIDLNHYTNLRPLCSYINRWVKRDIVNFEPSPAYLFTDYKIDENLEPISQKSDFTSFGSLSLYV